MCDFYILIALYSAIGKAKFNLSNWISDQSNKLVPRLQSRLSTWPTFHFIRVTVSRIRHSDKYRMSISFTSPNKTLSFILL